MIYVTDDKHTEFDSLFAFADSEEGRILTKSDIVIVLGDFGTFKHTIDEIQTLDRRLPYTLAFLDGNHEDFSLLRAFPEKTMWGGRVHDLNGVYHLCRGEIFRLPDGETFRTVAVCGGGDSRDREERTEGFDWFPEEAVTDSDVERLRENIRGYEGSVDYFLSHVPAALPKMYLYNECVYRVGVGDPRLLPTDSDYKIQDMVNFVSAKMYYCGHEHLDTVVDYEGKKYRFLSKRFEKLV